MANEAPTGEVGSSLGYQYLYSIISLLMGFGFYIFAVHFYPTQIVGLFAMLSALTALLAAIFSLNLGSGIQHFISYYIGSGDLSSIKKLVRKFSIIIVILSVAAFLFLWFSAPLLDTSFFHVAAYTEYIRLLGFGAIAMVSNNLLNSIVLGLQRFKANALIGIFSSIFTYSLIIAMLAILQSPILVVIGWIIGYSTTTCVLLIYVISRLRKIRLVVEGKISTTPVIWYSLPLLFSSIVGTSATYADRFIAAFFLNLSQIGIYNFALLIVSAFGIISAPFFTILFPKLSELYGKKEYERLKYYNSKAIELLMAVYLPIAFIAAAISRSLLSFLAGSAYLFAWIPVTIILVFNAVFISAGVIGLSLQATRKTSIFLYSSSVSLLTNLAISVLLIPRFGIEGAAIGFSSLYAVRFSVMLYFGRKYSIVYFEMTKISKIFGSAFVVFLVLFLLQTGLGYTPLKMFAYIILGLIIYMLLLKALKTFNDDDIGLFLDFAPKNLSLKRMMRIMLTR